MVIAYLNPPSSPSSWTAIPVVFIESKNSNPSKFCNSLIASSRFSNVNDRTNALSLLAIVSNYNNAVDSIEEMKTENEKLKADKEELLKVNGKLFQKIGFEKDEEDSTTEETKDDVEEIKIEDIIDEKGDLKDE